MRKLLVIMMTILLLTGCSGEYIKTVDKEPAPERLTTEMVEKGLKRAQQIVENHKRKPQLGR